jgi:hypothetical protein
MRVSPLVAARLRNGCRLRTELVGEDVADLPARHAAAVADQHGRGDGDDGEQDASGQDHVITPSRRHYAHRTIPGTGFPESCNRFAPDAE